MSVKLYVRYAAFCGVPIALATVKVPALDWARERWQLTQLQHSTTLAADMPSNVEGREPDENEQEYETAQAQASKAPTESQAVQLRCDHCGKHIDDLSVAMFFWWTEDGEADSEGRQVVRRIAVGHKGCYPTRLLEERSSELYWFGTKEAASVEVDALVSEYQWTPAQLDRLNQVARTVPLIATAADATAAARFIKDRPSLPSLPPEKV